MAFVVTCSIIDFAGVQKLSNARFRNSTTLLLPCQGIDTVMHIN